MIKVHWSALIWLTFGRLVQSITCTSKPLVWKIQQGKRFAYIVGIYNLPESKAPPLEGGPMAQALSCCDIAYFPTGCSLADKSNVTGVGNYMAHCSYYPVTREKDSIAERVPQQIPALKDALENLTRYAPPECKTFASEFLSSVQPRLNASTYRNTLLDVFHKGVKSTNPLWCGSDSGMSMDSFLRQQWGQRKPIFGLEDVSVECQAFQGNTLAEDQTLASFMISHFNQPWLAQMSKYEEEMAQVMKCGDLDLLAQVVEGMKDLPLRSVTNMQNRNHNLAFGVQKALEAFEDKNIFFAIPVSHLVDAAGQRGVITLLTQEGLVPERQLTSSVCQASSWEAPGAAALDHCLKPPAQSQPLSCIQFEKQFAHGLGTDVMHGRTVTPGPRCDYCVPNSTVSCTCEMTWHNYENFENLCKSTQVDGVHGVVYYLDMIRNPGSTREGLRLARKTVAGLDMRCYASSCDIPIIQEMATRNWYKNDKSLDVGAVTVRKVDQGFGFTPLTGTSELPWWLWLLAGLVMLCCILGLVRLFFVTPLTKKNGSVRKSWEMDPGLKGDLSETEPLKVPMNANRDAYDRRDVQNLGTLPSGTDIQMPDMRYPMQSGISSGGSFPRGPPPVPPPYRGPGSPTGPAPVVPMVPVAMPPVTAVPQVYSLQGYQGSMPANAMVAQPASYDASLLALSGQLASQLENSGAEAIRSLRHGQAMPQGPPQAYAPQAYAPQAYPTQAYTPSYQPVQTVPPQYARQ